MKMSRTYRIAFISKVKAPSSFLPVPVARRVEAVATAEFDGAGVGLCLGFGLGAAFGGLGQGALGGGGQVWVRLFGHEGFPCLVGLI